MDQGSNRTYTPVRIEEEETISRRRQANGMTRQPHRAVDRVGNIERFMSCLVGGGLLVRSIMQPPGLGNRIVALAGVALLHRAVTGSCPAHGASGMNRSSREDAD